MTRDRRRSRAGKPDERVRPSRASRKLLVAAGGVIVVAVAVGAALPA
jgi:hypothetical protein